MPKDEQDSLAVLKNLVDNGLQSFGILSPDKLMKMINDHEVKIEKLIKIVKKQSQEIKTLKEKLKHQKTSQHESDTSDSDLDDFDTL